MWNHCRVISHHKSGDCNRQQQQEEEAEHRAVLDGCDVAKKETR